MVAPFNLTSTVQGGTSSFNKTSRSQHKLAPNDSGMSKNILFSPTKTSLKH